MGRVRPNRPRNPSVLGDFIDTVVDIASRVESLEAPSGSERFGSVSAVQSTLDRLAQLRTHAVNGSTFVASGVPATGAVAWFVTDAELVIEIPTGRATIEASVSEASITPGGNAVTALVSWRALDANGIALNNVGDVAGRLVTDKRLGASLTTGARTLEIPDTIAHPGPYVIRAFVGVSANVDNVDPVSVAFAVPTLTVKVIA